jgi:hypothetical protein
VPHEDELQEYAEELALFEYPGPGRPPKLTRELMDELFEARASGMSIRDSCRTVYLSHQSYMNYFARGAAEALAGKRTLYVEFFERVPCEEARGELFLRRVILRSIKDPSEKNQAAARMALATLQMRIGGKKGNKGRRLRTLDGEDPKPPQPTPGVERMDLSTLDAAELQQFRVLLSKVRRKKPPEEPGAAG